MLTLGERVRTLWELIWLVLCVNKPEPQGSQTLGQTLFWVCQ